MFARLCTAIFNYFDATVVPTNTNLLEPSKVAAAGEAMGLFNEWNIILEPQTSILNAGGIIDDADEFIKMSWTVREIAHVMTTQQFANPVWRGMSALTTESFVTLHMTKLATNPGAHWWDMNQLKNIPELVDPMTGERFEYCEIPWCCLPQEPIPEAVAKMRRIDERLIPAGVAWAEKWRSV